MELIAAGRDADVYALDGDRVLRRYRRPADTTDEARLTSYLHDQGYPVPRVYEAEGRDMVLERLHGPLMFDLMIAKPWRMRRHAQTLADLQARLHAIPAPGWLPASLHGHDLAEGPSGARVLHLDLHPLNVMLTERGPVVIDWTNAAAGDPAIDIAFTYLTLAGAQIPAAGVKRLAVEAFRGALLRGLRSRWPDDVRSVLLAAADVRTSVPNLDPAEAARMRRAAATYAS
jgi:aminoglycoside phosphotransferase (APT) family kinase protein